MKFKTSFLEIEIEWSLIIIIFISIFSNTFFNIIKAYYICYLFILFHELAHVLTAAIFNKPVNGLKLALVGVCARFDIENYKSTNMYQSIVNVIVYFAGPISNVLFALLFRDCKMIFEINMFLGIINLIPIRPLDGYNISTSIYNIFNNIITSSEKNGKDLVIIENISKFIVIFLSIYQLMYFKNPSMLLFGIYLYTINLREKQSQKISSILYNVVG